MTMVLTPLVLLDPLGSGAVGNYLIASLVSLGLAVLSIFATLLFVLAGRRPQWVYYVVAITCFVFSHWVFLRHSLEWWRGAMLEGPSIGPMFAIVPVLSASALMFIAGAPVWRRERDDRFAEKSPPP